jgi:hypothetical protein
MASPRSGPSPTTRPTTTSARACSTRPPSRTIQTATLPHSRMSMCLRTLPRSSSRFSHRLQIQARRDPGPRRRHAPPQCAHRNPRAHLLYPQRDRHLQDPPVGRPRQPRWPQRRRLAQAALAPDPPRLAVLVCLSQIPILGHGRGAAERGEDGHGSGRLLQPRPRPELWLTWC